MGLQQSFMLALKSLWGSKLRSFLTMLGIIIGVAAVIVLISLIDGMSKNLSSRLESMGTNLVRVTIMGRNSNRTVKPEDMQQLVEKNKEVLDAVAPNVSLSGITAKSGNKNIQTTVVGTNESYGYVNNKNIAYGRFLDYMDIERRQKVAVIGSYIAQELYGTAAPLNNYIKVNGELLNIVGVMEQTADSKAETEDDRIIIPYNVATRVGQNNNIGSYSFRATSKATVDQAVAALNEFLTAKFADTRTFRVFNQAEMLKQINEMTATMSTVLGGVAGISLLVGGIGIMNIMLVSVTERTKEIGIRKALGAKKRDILGQFVTEAATTSSIGGVFGIILGVGLCYVSGKIMSIDASPSANAIALAFGVSATIGILFGYFPANKAAKLNPIEALRYE